MLLGFYLIFLFTISFFVRKKGEVGYYLAGAKLSPLKGTLSLSATIIGASSTIGLVDLSYKVGLPASLWLIMGGLGLLLLSHIYNKYFQGKIIFTLPEYLGSIYGKEFEKALSFIILISWIGVISAQLLALSYVFSVFIGTDFKSILFLCTSILILYTSLGGQPAVILTDVLQFILLFIGILLLVIQLLTKVDTTSIPVEYFRFPLNNYFKLKDLLYFLFVLIPVYIIGPDIHSRLFCLSDVYTRKKVLKFSAFCLVVMGFLISLIGIFAHAFINNGIESKLLLMLVKELFPIGFLIHLIFISLLSALFSSADTCLMTSSTILIRDLFNLKGEKAIAFNRLAIVIIGLGSYFIAVNLQGIIEALLLSYSIYTAGVLIPFLLIPFKSKFRIKDRAIILSSLIGGLSALFLNLLRLKYLVFMPYLLSLSIAFAFSMRADTK